MSDTEQSSSSSTSDTEESSSWRSRLVDCLDDIQTAGDFSWTNTYDVFVNPGLEMDGHGQIPLPLCPRDAQVIKKACRPAPFGIGDQTVVDDSVRKTWELDSSQFRLANPRWQAFLDGDILAAASQKLGLDVASAMAKPHKLLLYEPGSFFKPHKDSQKEPGMIGTLVVCLPSEHQGGDVRLSFRRQKRGYATGPASKFDLTALAWFGDVSHEVEELTSGYRLVLTYNIVLTSGSSPPSASFFDAQTEELQRILASWRETDRSDFRVYYPLEHQYSQSSLSLGNLNGRDAAVCQLLHHVASAAGFSVFLANMTHHKERREDDDDEEKRTELRNIYTCHGQLIARSLAVHPHEIPYPQLSYDDDDAADSEDEPDFLGNEDSPACFRYHHTIVVIHAKSKLDSLLGLDRDTLLVDALISELAQDFENRPDDEAVTCATRFMKACFRNWKHTPKSTLPQMVQWGVALGDDALYKAAVKAGHHQPPTQKAVARLVEKEYSERANPDGFTAQDWDKWYADFYLVSLLLSLVLTNPTLRLGVVVKTVHSITWLRTILSQIASYLEDTQLQASFSSWKDATLMTQLETKPQLEDHDHDIVIDAMLAHHNDAEWLTTRLLPNLCSHGTKPLLCKVLSTVLKKKEFALDETKAIFKQIMGKCNSTFSLRTTDFGDTFSHSDTRSAFVSLIDQCLGLYLTDSVHHILEKSCRRFEAAPFPHKPEARVAKLLGDLMRTLQKQDSVEPSTTSAVKVFFETALRRGILHRAPVYPVENFKVSRRGLR
ncbi:hypothetical protein QQX98_010678 [Neonectria punicea]|uniref:Prolyl 4-hydroxylase alpha subunit Fe(2+) 2OG dioxygenase domain-containing protein n=1 Tax=Neonectria punicea TaxID=979145 RepID=A0ABR1GNU0_9HYPO